MCPRSVAALKRQADEAPGPTHPGNVQEDVRSAGEVGKGKLRDVGRCYRIEGHKGEPSPKARHIDTAGGGGKSGVHKGYGSRSDWRGAAQRAPMS